MAPPTPPRPATVAGHLRRPPVIRVVDAATGSDLERAAALAGASGPVSSAAAVLLAVEREEALGAAGVRRAGPASVDGQLTVHVRPGPRTHRVVRTLVDAAVRRGPALGLRRLLVDVEPSLASLFATAGFRPVEGADPGRYERTLG